MVFFSAMKRIRRVAIVLRMSGSAGRDILSGSGKLLLRYCAMDVRDGSEHNVCKRNGIHVVAEAKHIATSI